MINRSNEPFYYKHRTFFVGLFLAVPVVVVVIATVFTAIKSEIMTDWTTIHIKSESGAGLIKGRTPVQIMGMDVGHIYDVDINPEGYVDVGLKIKTKYASILATDSKARLMQKNIVVGDWIVDLTVGSNAYLPIQNGDTLNVEYTVRLDELMELFTNFMDPLKLIVQSLQEGEGLVKYLLGSDSIVSDIHKLIGSADHLMTRTGYTMNKANKMLDNFNEFGNHGIATVDSLMTFAISADRMVKDLNNTVYTMDTLFNNLDSIPTDFHNVMEHISAELDQVDLLFKALENHWLLKRSIRRQKEKTLETK